MDIILDDFKSFLSVKVGVEPSTIHLLINRFNFFSRWLLQNSLTWSASNVERFLYSLKERGCANSTINSYIHMLIRLWGYCQDRGVACENFAKGLKMLPRTRPPIKILSEAEKEKLLAVSVPYGAFGKYSREEVTKAKNSLYRIFTKFLMNTGARIEEAASLQCQDIDIWGGKIIFRKTKNKQSRSVWITEPLLGEIREMIKNKQPEDLVFTNYLKNKINTRYNRHLKQAAKIAGITKHVHPHIFRHTFGTELYEATKDIGLIQLVLGHNDIKSSMIYIHLAEDSIKKGIYRHPSNRQHLDPLLLIQFIEEAITTFRLEENSRFDYVKVKEVITQFIINLQKAIHIEG